MSLLLKPTKSTARLSSQALDKRLKSLQNLSKTPPTLWRRAGDEAEAEAELDDRGRLALKLSHPLLRAVDRCHGRRAFDRVNAQLTVSGLFQHSLAASRAVKKLCSDPATLSHAVRVFDRIEEPDAFLCNLVMRSFVNLDESGIAIGFYYQRMVARSVAPNHYTFPILVKACVRIGDLREGQKGHLKAVKLGFGSDLFVGNSLIRMYSVLERVRDARRVFDEMTDSDLVSCNSMIYGYVKSGEIGIARKLFEVMPERDAVSWNTLVSGYADIGSMEAARLLFDILPDKDVVSWNCMIDGYARVTDTVAARELFDRMPFRNVVSWNTMLSLYVRVKDYGECLRLFDRMLELGETKPNEATLVSVLTACANFARLDRGKSVHSYIEANKIKPDVLLSTALMTMYAKCGDIEMAKNVFDSMPERSVVSWNSMIMGYGMHGNGEKALETFLEMEKQGFVPNDATFVCVLSACTHSGMLMEGWWYFDLMRRVYKIEPKIEHYGCIVDLIARAGLVKDSEEFIKKTPVETGAATWGSLLSACRTHSNLELGEIVAKRLIELEPEDIGPYIMLSNIYASNGKWDEIENLRKMLSENGLQKVGGRSAFSVSEFGSIENGSVHRRTMVHSMLSELGTQMKLSH